MPPRKYSSAPTGEAEEIVSTEGLTFELDGETFECHGQLDPHDLADLATVLMDAGDGWIDPEALAAVGTFFRLVLGDATSRAFSRHRRKHRTPPSVVSQIMMDLIEEVTERPPGRQSPSPAGQPPTAASSPAGSPSPAAHPPVPVPGETAPAARARDGIPAELRDLGDFETVPAQAAGQEPPEDTANLTHRTINLGDIRRTRVAPLFPDAVEITGQTG